MDMKLHYSMKSIVRLGICIGAAIIYSAYFTHAISHDWGYYRLSGILIVFSYTLIIVLAFKKIYPVSYIAFWQMCITFCLVGFLSHNLHRNLIRLIETNSEGENDTLVNAAIYQTQSGIAFQAAGLLFAVYIILRLVSWIQSLIKSKSEK